MFVSFFHNFRFRSEEFVLIKLITIETAIISVRFKEMFKLRMR